MEYAIRGYMKIDRLLIQTCFRARWQEGREARTRQGARRRCPKRILLGYRLQGQVEMRRLKVRGKRRRRCAIEEQTSDRENITQEACLTDERNEMGNVTVLLFVIMLRPLNMLYLLLSLVDLKALHKLLSVIGQ